MNSDKPVPLTIGFVGESHLSYVTAVASAECGMGAWKIVCLAKEHSMHVIEEPGLNELLDKNEAFIQLTSSPEDLRDCDIVYIAMDVPTTAQGDGNVKPVLALIDWVKSSINQDATLVVLSQVPPGFTRQVDFPKDRLYHQVETLVFGRAVERALHPERFIMGASARNARMPDTLRSYLEKFLCPIFVMNYESSELAKISINLYLSATVATTNMLAEISEKIEAHWNDIVETLKLDKRIGPHAYLKPGLGLSGGNLERDMATVQKLAREHKTGAGIVDAQILDSQYRLHWVQRKLREVSPSQTSKVGVLGLAYKENTHSLKNSPSINFIKALPRKRVAQVFDPIVKRVKELEWLPHERSAQAVIDQADVLAVLTPWTEFSSLDYTSFQGRSIIDPFNLVQGAPAHVKVHVLGEK